jgi:hypothetical protein
MRGRRRHAAAAVRVVVVARLRCAMCHDVPKRGKNRREESSPASPARDVNPSH